MNLINIKNRPKKIFFLFFFIFFQLIIISGSYYSSYIHVLWLLILILNIYPLYKYSLNFNFKNEIPLFEFTHIYFFICYTLAILYREGLFGVPTSWFATIHTHRAPVYINTNDISFVLEIYFLGLFFFNIGNYLIKKNFKKKMKVFNSFNIDKNNNELLIIGLFTYFILLIFFYFFKDLQLIKKLYQIKFPLIYFSILTIYLYILRNLNLNLLIKSLLIILIAILIILELMSGSITFSILLLLSIYLLNFIYTKKFYFRIIIIFFTIFFILHLFKGEYRAVSWKVPPKNLSLEKKSSSFIYYISNNTQIFISTYFNSFKKFSDMNFEEYKNEVIDRNFGRLFHSFSSLLVVTIHSPNEIPYWEGYSYKILYSRIVPRIFWSNKPSDNLGNAFGHRYKVLDNSLSEFEHHTSWNMPVLNEFYVNFGALGVSIGMFIIGVLYRIVPYYFYTNKNNYLFLILFISIYPLFHLESHASLVYGKVIQTYIFLLFYVFILKKILNMKKKLNTINIK